MLIQSFVKNSTQTRLWICSSFHVRGFHQTSEVQKDVAQSDDEYQYLHRSILPTYTFQRSLMRLPIPDLNKTCDRYLKCQRVILNDADFSHTETAVNTFRSGIGLDLQKDLKNTDKMNKHTSYISQDWFDMYLSDRAPVVLNYNPFLTMYPEERPGYDDPIIRATNILVSSMRFHRTLRECLLEPEVYHLNAAKSDTEKFRKVISWCPTLISSLVAMTFKAFPLDMSQFDNLFNSTRIPLIGKDTIKMSREAKHMLIMKNGNFYIFDIYDNDGNLYSPSHIHACVSYIYNDNSQMPKNPIGVLTATNRDEWAKARLQLVEAGNEETLDLLDTAAFNLVFDDVVTGVDPEKCYRNFLYGDCANRWFDKSFSLIFSKDGMASINFEHAWGDGVAVMRYFNEIDKDCTQNSSIHPDSKPANVDASALVRKLEFKVPQSVEDTIQSALVSTKKTTDSLGLNILDSNLFGKNFCKKHKVSPDAVMQLGFQVAYKELTGKTTATYESCSTSAFKNGRTETIRPATAQTAAFTDAVTSGKSNNTELKGLIKEASTVHGQLTKEAAMGQGFDRHLFGLRKVAERLDVSPDIFKDEAYAKINYNILSTSTLPSNRIIFGGFAPVVLDGLGVGYQIKDETLGLAISSYPPNVDGKGFVECAERAYKKIKKVLEE